MNLDDLKENSWKISTIALLVVSVGLGALLAVSNTNCPTGFFLLGNSQNSVNSQNVASDTLDFVNQNMIQRGEASLESVEETSGIYKLITSYQGRNITLYATKDGKYLMMQGVNTEEFKNNQETQSGSQQQTNFDAPDKETPTVELFVMSFCPYGNQAEQTMEPVYKKLGDSVNWEPHYIVSNENGEISSLHGQKEVEQNKRELCVLKDHGVGKWFDFVNYVNENCGSAGGCWKEAASEVGLDSEAIQTCADERGTELLKKEAEYAAESKASGSPTMLVNGEKTSAVYQYGNPDVYKDAICSGFSTKPEECSQNITSVSTSSTTGGSCG